LDVSSKGRGEEGVGESKVGLLGERVAGEIGSARGKGSGMIVGIAAGERGAARLGSREKGSVMTVGIAVGDSAGKGDCVVCVAGDAGIKCGKTGGGKLTGGRKEASDAAFPVAERCEEAFSFAGNEASSKTTCLER